MIRIKMTENQINHVDTQIIDKKSRKGVRKERREAGGRRERRKKGRNKLRKNDDIDEEYQWRSSRKLVFLKKRIRQKK